MNFYGSANASKEEVLKAIDEGVERAKEYSAKSKTKKGVLFLPMAVVKTRAEDWVGTLQSYIDILDAGVLPSQWMSGSVAMWTGIVIMNSKKYPSSRENAISELRAQAVSLKQQQENFLREEKLAKEQALANELAAQQAANQAAANQAAANQAAQEAQAAVNANVSDINANINASIANMNANIANMNANLANQNKANAQKFWQTTGGKATIGVGTVVIGLLLFQLLRK